MNTKKPQANLISAADSLFVAQQTRIPCQPVTQTQIPANDIDTAYEVQQYNTHRWLEQGRQIVGYKIGLTSSVVQKQLGVDQPDFGVLFADMAVADGEEIAAIRVMQPKVEAEVAFIMKKNLDKQQLTMVDVLVAIEYVLAAIEVVDSRIKDWQISIADTIADNASSGLFVLGNQPWRIEGLDLRNAGMQLLCRDEPVSTGAGVACLGHPLNALLWLARKLVAVGTPIQAGQVVLSGALGPMVAVQMGEVYEASIHGLGTLRAAFQRD